MEILELQKRINDNLDRVNNAKSISSQRRYFVYLSGLVAIYNELTHENLQVAKYDKSKIMKHTFSEALIKELFLNGGKILARSCNIVETFKKCNWESMEHLAFNTYSPTILSELFDEFIFSLGIKYERIFKNVLKSNRLFLSKEDISGATIFDYETKDSYLFLPSINNNLYFYSILAHEMGHIFEYERTKNSRKTIFVNNFNATTEIFSLFIEILFCDFLKKVNFNELEIKKLENKYYGDFLTYATQVKFALSCPYTYIDLDGQISVVNSNAATSYLYKLENEDKYKYYINGMNLADAIYYVYGYFIADTYLEYYNIDKNFIKEIENHFFDYESYSNEEILEKLPFINSISNFDILNKHLKN